MKNLRWNLNISQSLDTGGRNHMEDFCYNHIEKNGEYVIFSIFGIFDGHGGSEAAEFVQKTLKNELVKIKQFWSNDNSHILESIRLVYAKIQKLLWIERENWVRTIRGYKSTAGTTATIAIIRNGILYTGHVGDSGILLLYIDETNTMQSEEITIEHKPDSPMERRRIEDSGGTLKRKAGIDRVVWNRPKLTKTTEIDQIPFLAVARSLGDLWSYDMKTDRYHVSPEPDVKFIPLEPNSHRAIIIGSDGLWNVINRTMAVNLISLCLHLNKDGFIYNPSQMLVNYCIYQWRLRNMKADNISAIVIIMIPESTDVNINFLESPDVNNHIKALNSEFLENKLFENCKTQESVAVLENIVDFSEFSMLQDIFPSIYDQDVELLQLYVQSNKQLFMYCDSWAHLNHYWYIFIKALKYLGFTSFPKIISYFDTCSAIRLEELLVAFPWSICCLELSDSISLSNKAKNILQHQPLMTEFWTSFYKNIVKKNVEILENQLRICSKIDNMKNFLARKSCDINDWVSPPINENCEFSITNGSKSRNSDFQSKFSLKKSKTCNDYSSVNSFFSIKPLTAIEQVTDVYKCFQLKRSASFDYSKSQFYCGFKNNLTPIDESGSTTPIISTSDCDMSNSITSPNHTKRLMKTKKRSNVPLSLKRKVSQNVTQLILIPREEPNHNSKVIRRFTLSRKKRLIL